MNMRLPLVVAIAATLLSAGVHAATPLPLAKKLRDATVPTSASSTASAQRFIVKTRTVGTQARTLLSGTLSSAVSRAGLRLAVPATATAPARGAASARILRDMAIPGWHVVQTTRKLTASESSTFLRELQADPNVISAEPDRLYHNMDVQRTTLAQPKAAAPDDPGYAQLQWNFTDPTGGVNAQSGWDYSTGKGVVVAVVDTGVAQGNPELADHVLPGYDMISDRFISRRDTDARVPGGYDLGDWVEENYCDQLGGNGNAAEASSWHGSHVSGTIAQVTNNAKGVAGLAYDARILPVRVLGSCGGYGSDIADGMLWAAGLPVDGLPINPNPAEVLNLSLGSSSPESCPTLYQDTIDKVNATGSIVVVAAGNSNADASTYTMSSCAGVISVGANRVTGGRASYSNYGSRVDIAAPGGGGSVDGDPRGYIFQVVNSGLQGPTSNWEIGGFTGTSMASPHVAAAVALVQAVASTPYNSQQMRDLLRKSSRPFPVAIPVATPIGAGILDVGALLKLATGNFCDPQTDPTCTPSTTALSNKVAATNLSSQGGDLLFSFTAQAGQVLSFMSFGGSGTAEMYAAFGRVPTSADYDVASTRTRVTSQTVRFAAPQAGTYYLRISGSFAGMTAVARQ